MVCFVEVASQGAVALAYLGMVFTAVIAVYIWRGWRGDGDGDGDVEGVGGGETERGGSLTNGLGNMSWCRDVDKG